METTFKAWKTSRRLYLNFFESCSLEMLNKIPDGFNNNLIWNIGHAIVAQQRLVYTGSNLESYLSEELLLKYQSGTKPTAPVTQDEADELKNLLTSLIPITEQDYAKGKFVTYNPRTTGTGFHLGSIQDAFEFNNYHEGLHLGYMMSMRKALQR